MTRRTVPVRGSSGGVSDAELNAIAGLTSAANKVPYFTGSGTAALADFTAFGRGLVGRSLATFSNADATVDATTAMVTQIGTMSAIRTVTLPAANAVQAGTPILVADMSGTVTQALRIIVAPAGADTIEGGYPHIIVHHGWIQLVSDGTSKWLMVGSQTPHLLWASRGATDYSTKTNDTSAVATIAYGAQATLTGNLGGDAFNMSTTGGAATRYTAWALDGATGPTLPTFQRYELSCMLGARATNLGAFVGVGQGVTRMIAVFRNSASPGSLDVNLRNDTTTASVTSSAATVGGNTDAGGRVRLSVEVIQPVNGVSQPDMVWDLNEVSRAQVAALSGTNWRDGGNLRPIIGCFEIAGGASTTFVRDIIMQRHRRDRW